MSVIRIGGKQYQVKVDRFGNQSVNGMSVDDFMKSLTIDQLIELSELGKRVVDGTLSTSPQAFMDAKNQSKKTN